MPANIETGVYANTPAWHGEGTVLDTDGKLGIDVDTALDLSGLDWEVEKVPVFAKHGRKQVDIENRFGVQRKTDGEILGVVGKTWKPVQNAEGFQILQDIMELERDQVWIEAAGALDGGREVWVLAHLAEDLFIAGEQISQYILFTNGHNGRKSVTAAITDVRVVCQNTLAMALEMTPRILRVRHTVHAGKRLTEAKHLLGLRSLRAEALAKQGEWMANEAMDDVQFEKFLDQLMTLPTDDEGSSPARTMMEGRRETLTHLYRTADNLGDIRGTRWGVYNAVVEYADYHRRFESAATQTKAQFADQPIKTQALTLLSAR